VVQNDAIQNDAIQNDSQRSAVVGAPPPSGSVVTLLPPPSPSAIAVPRPRGDANWLVHESIRRNIRLRITERDLFVNDVHVPAASITNVAFWSPRSSQHEFIFVSPATRLSFCVRDDHGDTTPSTSDFIAVVRYLDDAVLPRLVQQRLQTIDSGSRVAIDRLTIGLQGLRWKARAGANELAWTNFDHVAIHRECVEIVARKGRRLRTFTEIPLDTLDAVLVPLLVPAAAKAFGFA
jgi:hypothetical protein